MGLQSPGPADAEGEVGVVASAEHLGVGGSGERVLVPGQPGAGQRVGGVSSEVHLDVAVERRRHAPHRATHGCRQHLGAEAQSEVRPSPAHPVADERGLHGVGRRAVAVGDGAGRSHHDQQVRVRQRLRPLPVRASDREAVPVEPGLEVTELVGDPAVREDEGAGHPVNLRSGGLERHEVLGREDLQRLLRGLERDGGLQLVQERRLRVHLALAEHHRGRERTDGDAVALDLVAAGEPVAAGVAVDLALVVEGDGLLDAHGRRAPVADWAAQGAAAVAGEGGTGAGQQQARGDGGGDEAAACSCHVNPSLSRCGGDCIPVRGRFEGLPRSLRWPAGAAARVRTCSP